MRTHYTLLAFAANFFSIATCFAQSGKSLSLDLSPGFIRQEIYFSENQKEIELCHLIPGATYEVFSVGGDDCRPDLVFNNQAFGKKLTLTAGSDCEVILLEKNDGACRTPFWLSVAKEDDESASSSNGLMEYMANLSVSGGVSAQSLIENTFIGGGCFEVSNVIGIGSAQGRGTFSSGGSTIGIESGVILSTGNINNAPGPNDDDGAGNNLPGGGGDPDLNILAGGGTVTDVTGIEFNFTPTISTIDFNYVFASEEYCEYGGTPYKDILGFFISGPGINGAFTFNGENIAVLPGSGIAVAINNVNHNSNTGYFVPNRNNCNGTTNMNDIQFDGWTAILTATATVTPCETYKIRLVVGDMEDSIYDSAVFLQENSFAAGGDLEAEAVSAITGTNLVYESCNDGVITFTRTGDLTQPLTITWTIDPASTATPGVDYDALPTSVTIPAGAASVDVILNVIADLLVEGLENIILNIDNACSCTASELEILIDDPPLLEATLEDKEICEGESVTLSPTVEADLEITGYEWTPSGSGSSISETPLTTTTYTVTVTDECGGTDTASATVTVVPMATAEILGTGTLCAGSGDTVHLTVHFTGDPEWTFTYTLDGVPQPPITTSDNPYTLVVDQVGTYGLQDLASGTAGCPGTVSGSAVVNESEITPTSTSETATCTQENGSIDLTPAGGTAPYTYNWDNGSTDEDLEDVGPGTYVVTVTDNFGCTGTHSATVDDTPNEPSPSANTTASLCGLANGDIDLTVTGGDPPYTYIWSTGSTDEDLTDMEPGSYTVTVTGDDGCTAELTVELENDNPPISITPDITPNTVCPPAANDGGISITVSPTAAPGGGTYVVTWSNGGSGFSQNDLPPGSYSVTVSGGGECEETASFEVPDEPNEPSLSATPTASLCGLANGEIDLSVSGGVGPFTYNWDNGSTEEDLTDVTPGTYCVTATGANGCTAETCVTLPNENPPISITADIDPNTTCPPAVGDGGISINISPTTPPQPLTGYDITWSNGGSGFSQNDLAPGSYSVTVSAGGECSEVASFEVPDEPNEPSLSATPTASLCGLANGDIDLTVSGGVGPFTYNWDNGSTDEDLTDVTSATYCVTTTGANGCTAETCVSLPNENPPISITADIDPNTTCPPAVGDGGISINISPTTPPPPLTGYDITWSNGGSGFSQNDLPPGSYSVTVSAGGECSQTASFEVPDEPNEPSLSATPTASLCGLANGDIDLSVSGGVGPFTYNWDNGETGEDLTDVAPGTYCVTVTGTNGCSAETCVSLPNENPPISITADIDPNTACPPVAGNGDISINISPTVPPPPLTGYDITWSNGGSGFSQNDLAPGSYSVTVSAGGECSQTASFEVPDQPDLPSVSPIVNPSLCGLANGSIDLSVSGGVAPFDIVWSNGEMGTPLVGILSGNYSVTVTGANGCSTTMTVFVPDEDFPINITSSETPNTTCPPILPNGSISINISPAIPPPPLTGYDITWSNGGSGLSQNDLSPGTYSATVSAGGTCTQVTSFEVPDQPNEPSLSAIPTPSLCGLANGDIDLSVSSGVAPFTYQWDNGSANEDLTDMPPGIYCVTVTGANGCSAETCVGIPNDELPISVTADIFPNTACPPAVGTGSISINISPAIPPPPLTDYDITWSNGGSGFSQNDLLPGTYSVTVSAGAGCSEVANFEVPDQPVVPAAIPIVTPSVCGLANGSIDLSISGGVAPYGILWSNGATGTPLIGILSGNYTVTVTGANGCSTATALFVSDEVFPISVIPSGTPNTACPPAAGTGSVSINISPTIPPAPFTGYDINWSNGGSGLSQTGLLPGAYSVTVSAGGTCTQVANFNVQDEPDEPELSPSAVAATCGESNGEASISAIGGQAPFTYQWSNGGTDPSIPNVPGGNYTVTVTGANGCSAVASATVQDVPIPISIASNIFPNLTCEPPGDGSINLSVTPATATIAWSTGETGQSISHLAPGTYSVTVSVGGTCVETEFFTVPDESEIPTLNTQPIPSICNEENGSVTLEVNSGISPYQFQWSNGSAAQNLTNVFAGQYTVTVTTSAGCTAVTSVNVPNNEILFNVEAQTTGNTSCAFPNGAVELVVNPPGSYTYQWSNGETTPFLSNVPAGAYSVTVSAGGTCTQTAVFNVFELAFPPNLSASAVAATCDQSNGSVNLNVEGSSPPFQFIWSNGATSEDLSNVPPGQYDVTVTDANGCTAATSANVASNNIPINLTGIPVPNVSCILPNGELDLTISPPGTYDIIWSNGETSEDLSDLPSGGYSVTVSAGGDCISTAVYFVPNATEEPQLSENILPAICSEPNGEIDLTVSPASGGPFDIFWSNGETTEDLTDLLPGDYEVTVTGTNGCTSTALFNVPNNSTNFTVSADASPDDQCDEDNGAIDLTVTPAGTYSIAWSNGETTEDLADLPPGTYTVTVTATGSCEATASFVVADETSFPSLSQAIEAEICGQENGAVDLEVSGGTEPYVFTWSNGETGEDLSDLPSGTYLVTVTGDNGCSATAEATVPENSISIDLMGSPAANTSCDVVNGAIDLTVDPPGTYSFEWSNGAVSQSISGLAGGTYAVTVSAGGDCSAVANFTVPSTTTDPVLAQTITPSVCGESNGAIDLEVTAGVAPFTFEWSNGSTNEDLSLIPADAYSVTVTGANGCPATASFNVPDNPIILNIAGLTGPNTSCDISTGEIDITVTPPGIYAFEWSNDETTEDLSGLEAGNYTVTVFEGVNCQAEANFIVGNDTNAPDITPTVSAATCGQATGGIDILPTGGTTPYSYEWSNGETTEDIGDLIPGSYSLTITGGDGCANTGNFTVPDDLIQIDISGMPSANTACFPAGNPNGGIEIDILPTGTYDIEWSNGEFTNTLNGLEPGSYEVTVSAGGDCSSVASFQVPNNPDQPTLSESVTASICSQPDGGIDLEVTGGVGPFDFDWSNGETSEDLTDLLSGDYAVTVTAANGCSAVAAMNVPNFSNTFSMLADLTENTLCVGANGAIDLTVEPVGTYLFEWSNGEVTEDLTDLAPGDYTVTVTDDGTCSASQTFTVPNESPAPALTGEATDILCFGQNTGAIDLSITGGIGPYQIEWSPAIPGNPEDPTGLFAGGYSVVVTDAAGCASEMEFDVSQPTDYVVVNCSQVASVTAPGGSDGVGGVDISGGVGPYTVTWSPGASQSGVGPGIFSISDLEEGIYDVTVVDANGCETTCDFLISGCQTAVGSMSGTVLDLCGDGCLTANYDALAQFLEPDDTLEFVLHTGSANLIVGEIARSDEPTFCFDPGLMAFGETYFISAVAGNDDGTGSVDLADDCTVVSFGTPIIFYETPVASLNQPGPLTCDVSEVDLLGSSTLPGSLFEWTAAGGGIISGNPTSPNVVAASGGIYTLIVTSPTSECADTVAVNVDDLSADIQAGIVASPNEILDCVVSFITLDGSATGSPNLMFEWYDAGGMISNDASINVTEGGIYTLIAFDPLSNCADTATVEIQDNSDFPPLFLDPPPFLDCFEPQGMISGGSPVAGVEFLWATIEGGDTTILGSGVEIPVTEPGTYWLIGLADNGCENAISLTVDGDLLPPSANAGDDQSLDCFQNEIELTGTSNSVDVTFEWSGDNPDVVISNPDFPTITVDEPGTYTLTVTALGNGCTALDQVVVDLFGTVPQGLFDLDEPDCFGDENGSITVLTDPDNGPYIYSLDGVPNGGSNTFYPLASGTYLIEVTDGIGCTWTTTVYLPQPNPLEVELGGDLLVELGDEVTMQVLYTVPTSQLDTILWQPEDELPCPQMPCDVQTIMPVNQTIVSVTVVDTNGCMADDLIQLFVKKDRSVYIPNAFSPNGDGINDIFMIYASDEVVKIKEFLVFSRWGESVFEYYNFTPNNPAYGWDGTHRGQELDPAVFAWFAVVEFVDGQEVLFEGDVTLMR